MDKLRKKRRPIKIKKTASPEQLKKIKRRLVSILLLFMLIWLFVGFMRSDFFLLEEIAISGNTHTSESEIRTALAVSEGINLWEMNPAQLEERVASIPRIAAVEVSRRLPRAIDVEIQEKEAMALVPYREYLLEVGFDGVILGTTEDPKQYGRPLLTGLGSMELTVGKQLLTEVQVQATGEVVSAMDEEVIAISEVNLSDEENMVVTTLDGLTVWLGRGEFAEKARLLKEIMGQLPVNPQTGYLDLRVTRAPNFHVLDDDKTQKNN